MSLTKRQLKLAARLYGLAVMAHQDAGGAATEEETAVMHQASEDAQTSLGQMGYVFSDLPTLQRCIAIAKLHA